MQLFELTRVISAMNIHLPSSEEIREAFNQDEDEGVALFDTLSESILSLSEQLKKQVEAD